MMCSDKLDFMANRESQTLEESHKIIFRNNKHSSYIHFVLSVYCQFVMYLDIHLIPFDIMNLTCIIIPCFVQDSDIISLTVSYHWLTYTLYS